MNNDLSGLNNESGLPHLSKVTVYETDIAPHPFIGIHAGVGSGKSYSIDMLARGYTDPDENGQVQYFPQQTILLITSKRSKVDELCNGKSIKGGFSMSIRVFAGITQVSLHFFSSIRIICMASCSFCII